MVRINDSSLDGLLYRRLSDTQIERLHEATLEILERIGIRYMEPGALEIFRKAGMDVDGDLVRIPSARVEWALRSAPKRQQLFNQVGEPAIMIEGRRAYFGNGSDLLNIIDHRTGERRLAVLQDVQDMVRVLDALENIDFIMSGFLPRDVPVDKAELMQIQVMLELSNKPMMYVVTDLALAQRVVAMAEVVAGGADALRQRPFAGCYINIANPLRHNPESIQKLIWLSMKGLPFTYRPALMTRGVTTPVTAAGFLAVQNAAALSGLVLSQLVREGTPFIRDACAGGTFDMRHMMGQHSAAEIRGFNEELLHYYGLPGFGIGGTTGAKVIDSQSGLEAALTLLTSVQAGANLIHDVGYMDNGITGSLEQVTICNEIISWIKAYLNPIQISPETLALDAIEEVVMGGGDFMGSENTVKHFREDLYPKLISRQNYDSWQMEGGKTMRERAKAHVEKVLAAPVENTLEQVQLDRIQTLVDLPV